MHQEGGCFLSLRISPHLFKVFIYLSHYSAPVASLTLQRNSYVVYLSRSDASPNSFTFLFLCSRSLRTKIVLNSLRFSIPFFFPICFYSFINSPQSWQLKLYVPMLPLFSIPRVLTFSLLAAQSPPHSCLSCGHPQWKLVRQACHYTAGQRDRHQYIATLLLLLIRRRTRRGSEERKGVGVVVWGGEKEKKVKRGKKKS